MILARWRDALTLLLICIAYGATLWGTSVPFTGDQKVYISIAQEMTERGSWLIPYLFEQVNFLKPPFQYWMTLGGWSIFGANSFGTFFPSVLALVGCAALVVLLGPGRRVHQAVFFSATLGTLTYGTTAQMEIWVTLFYLLAWFFFIHQRILATFVVVGVMSWIKGPLYPVLWCVGAFLYQILRKDLSILKNTKTWLALGVGIAIGLSWYFAAYTFHPDEVMSVFFKRENFEKIQTTQGSMTGLWGDFCFSLFPISFWLLMGIDRELFRKQWSEHKAFWMGFGGLFFLFFSFFPYRVGAYLYPLTPLVIWMLDGDRSAHRMWVKIIQYLVFAVAALLLFLVFRFFWGDWISFALFVSFTVTLIAWAYFHYRCHTWGVALSSLALVICIRFAAISIGESDIAGLKQYVEKNPEKRIAYMIDHLDIWHEWGWVSVAIQRPVERILSQDQLSAYLNQGGAVILGDEQQTHGVGLKCSDWPRLKRRMKFPLQDLVLSGLKRTDSNLLRMFRICSRRQE